MQIRCLLDGLLLSAGVCSQPPAVIVYDSGERFVLDALEALYYELVSATPDELLNIERAHYRLLRFADDFQTVGN